MLEFTFSKAAMAGLSSYAIRMARLSAQIFGEIGNLADSKSMKVVQLFQEVPLAKRKDVYEWYPQHKIYYAMTQQLRFMGLFRCCWTPLFPSCLPACLCPSFCYFLSLRDEHEDFKEEMLRLKKLRGKGKPKKGEGKRATRKKWATAPCSWR